MIDDIPIDDKTVLLALARKSIENSFKKLARGHFMALKWRINKSVFCKQAD